MEKLIRILMADDHAIVRQGIRTMLEPKVDIDLVYSAINGIEAIENFEKFKPDVVLMDLEMPRLSGLEAIKRIISLDSNAKILVLTISSEEDKVIAAIKNGAIGYILKDSSPKELVDAIRMVSKGELWIYSGLAPKIIQRLISPTIGMKSEFLLTDREIEVLKLIAKGLTNKEIAVLLKVQKGTIRFHVNNIFSKLNITNRTQAALYALREGLVTLF
jgi:DNA-binding NarL/FixJ family response regulator